MFSNKIKFLLLLQISLMGVFLSPLLAATNTTQPTYLVYPDAPLQPRIQFLKTINGTNFLSENSSPFGNRFPGFESNETAEEKIPLLKPYGIATLKDKIFVCDLSSKSATLYDLKSRSLKKFGEKELQAPFYITTDSESGSIYISDSVLNKVAQFNSNLQFVKYLGEELKMRPLDLTFYKGQLYVIDGKEHQVIVLNPAKGDLVRKIGKAGSQKGELFAPTHLTISKKGDIYISDTMNGRIVHFDNNGNFIANIGSHGDSLGQFARPKGVAIDLEERLYAVDALFENVQLFNEESKLLLFFASRGNEKGGINLPSKIHLDYDNSEFFSKKVIPGYKVSYLIYVASQFGTNKINVYGFLEKN